MTFLGLSIEKRREGEPVHRNCGCDDLGRCIFCLCCIPICIIWIVDQIMMKCCCAEGLEKKSERKKQERAEQIRADIFKRQEERDKEQM